MHTVNGMAMSKTNNIERVLNDISTKLLLYMITIAIQVREGKAPLEKYATDEIRV